MPFPVGLSKGGSRSLKMWPSMLMDELNYNHLSKQIKPIKPMYSHHVKSEIIEKATACVTTDESLLAIVEMGGLGMTTLTRKVFHLLKQKNRFGSHVSQIFDPIVLLKNILKELTSSDQVEVESSQDILDNLKFEL
ncbi:hypothetical protein SASPL_145528 [Salvia splendens]|uniref:NB-ARC domain-containing protein n=1 Tax=Salvia splendens TaxID=180675 RepID=A0A8X8Z882_SALSN|nr:hypothetical protein SASPL_145528 [Salvia splendens]